MTIWLNSILLVVITNWVLYQGYRYYEFEWPENYFGPEDKENIFLSTKPYYYFMFRILPVFIGIFVVQGIAYKTGLALPNPILLGSVTGLIFAIINDGKALQSLYEKAKDIKIFVNKPFQYLLHAISILLLPSSGFLAGWFIKENIFQSFLPKMEGLVDNIWASFFGVIIAFYLWRTVRKPKEITLEEVIDKTSKKIDRKIIEQIEDTSLKFNADPILVKSICFAENIVRPKWFRFLENFLGHMGHNGTFGIMQVASRKPISDIGSIKLAVERYFENSNRLDASEKIELIRKYNKNDKYIDLVLAIMRHLDANQ